MEKHEEVTVNPPPDPHGRPALDAMLAEYETVRQESMAAIGNRMTVMSFTLASFSIILAGLLTGKAPDVLAGVVALVAVPLLANAALLIWLGEYERSQRAGLHLVSLEKAINDCVGIDAMGWQKKLSSGAGRPFRHMTYPYVAASGVVLGIGYMGSALGISLLARGLHEESSVVRFGVLIGAIALTVVIEAAFIVFFIRRFRNANK